MKHREQHYQYRQKHNLRSVRLTIPAECVPLIKATIKAFVEQDSTRDKEVKVYIKQRLKEVK